MIKKIMNWLFPEEDNEFTLEHFAWMNSMMKKIGNMGDITNMMGMSWLFGLNSAQQKEIAVQGERMMLQFESAYNSMTPEERRNPDLIQYKRRRRIARGSGLSEFEIGNLLYEFDKMKEMFRQIPFRFF